jgi:hypothetical protein
MVKFNSLVYHGFMPEREFKKNLIGNNKSTRHWELKFYMIVIMK